MDLLRQILMITDSVEINFNVQLEIVNGTNLSNTCDNDLIIILLTHSVPQTPQTTTGNSATFVMSMVTAIFYN